MLVAVMPRLAQRVAASLASALLVASGGSGCTAPSTNDRPPPVSPRGDPADPAASPADPRAAHPPLDLASAERFAGLALACVHREYPNKIAHVLRSAQDVGAPSSLTPAFYGCFDWHSAVHGHWLLARVARTFPGTPLARRAKAALSKSLTVDNLAREVTYQEPPERAGFERPYGLAWLLQLGAELREWDDPDARRWSAALRPLEALAVKRLSSWIPKLSHPIRVGEHAQTAFAFGLLLDWARVAGDDAFGRLVAEHARRLHAGDRGCSLRLEPSGHDFLSPCLGAADLMRRVLAPEELARWLDDAMPDLPRDGSGDFLRPETPADRTDGKLVHLDGLNLSRAWMLEGIALGLPTGDARRAALVASARAHARAGLAAVSDTHDSSGDSSGDSGGASGNDSGNDSGNYSGDHWLGTFAVYLVTARGLPAASRGSVRPR